jgi:hypothetical protein
MVAVHGELEEAKLRLGIRTRMGYEKNPQFAADASQVVMREVG